MSKITVKTTINAETDKVWERFTLPGHIVHWNFASEDWACPTAVNDIRAGGRFNWRMEAVDGSTGFDFSGVYNEVIENEKITYTLDDGRIVEITFTGKADQTEVVETFEAESQNPEDLQKQGWQAILDNFKQYVESH